MAKVKAEDGPDLVIQGSSTIYPLGGMAMATYEPAGPLKTGSFATLEPSAAERRRRAKMEAGDW